MAHKKGVGSSQNGRELARTWVWVKTTRSSHCATASLNSRKPIRTDLTSLWFLPKSSRSIVKIQKKTPPKWRCFFYTYIYNFI